VAAWLHGSCKIWRNMTTIGEREPKRARWSDLQDSSTECLSQEDPVPQAPVIDSQLSYLSQDSFDDGGCRAGLHRHLESAARIGDATCAATSASSSPAKDACPSGNASATWQPSAPRQADIKRKWELNVKAPTFVPSLASVVQMISETPEVKEDETPQSMRVLARRRIKGKRSVSDVNMQARSSVDEMPEASEEDWQRRAAKRRQAVAAIKSSPEYKTFAAVREAVSPSTTSPSTPDPEDRGLSKRTWEAKVMQWRAALRNSAQDAGTDIMP